MSALDDLLDEIFDGEQTDLRAEFAAWARESRRFKAFATTYRAKLKNARGSDRLKDARAEWETAARLLTAEPFTLEYEKYAATRQRGPDFTVTFKTHTPFNVEVRRVEVDADDAEARLAKLMGVLRDKVGQMPPGIINVLWLVGDLTDDDAARAALTLRGLAERKVEDYFTRRGFENAAAFLKQYQQLSGIVLRRADALSLWLNPLARRKIPPDLAATLRKL